jgi:hypothetical protein
MSSALALLMLALLVACTKNNPIDVGNPIKFVHSTKTFSLMIPASWQHMQDAAPTEAVAVFTDPTQQAEVIAYSGLLDHRLTDDEGFKIAGDLTNNLLRHPDEFAVTDRQRRSDGAFVVKVAYSRNQQKHLGEAVLSDNDLTLSAVICDGAEAIWPQVYDTVQPFVTSFKADPAYVQSIYFVPVENTGFGFAGPAEWQKQSSAAGTLLRSPDGRVKIVAVQQPLSTTLDTPALAQATLRLAKNMMSVGKLVSSEQLPDGRTKLVLEYAQHRIIGYVDQKDQVLAGLLFDVPLEQADAYQPFIDFVYSTFVTGKP